MNEIVIRLLIPLFIFLLGFLTSYYFFRKNFYRSQISDINKTLKSIDDVEYLAYRCKNKDETLTDEKIQSQIDKFYDETFSIKGWFKHHRTKVETTENSLTIKGYGGDVFHRCILRHLWHLSFLQTIAPFEKEYFEVLNELESNLNKFKLEIQKLYDKAEYGGLNIFRFFK